MLSVIVLLLIGAWTVPFLFKAKPPRDICARIAAAFFLTAIVGMLLSVILEAVASKLIGMALPELPDYATDAIIAGVIEEMVKCGIALMIIRGLKDARPIDIILVFAAAGAGYETSETLMAADGLFFVIFRGVLAMHIIWQYFYGLGYIQSGNGKKLKLLRNFLIVIFLHISFDLSFGLINDDSFSDIAFAVSAVFTAVIIITNIVLTIRTVLAVWKECRALTL